MNIKNGGHYWGQVQLALKDLNAQLKTQDVSAVWTDLTPGKKVDELMRMLGGEYEKVWSEIRPGLVEKGMPLTWDALTRKEGDCTGLKCWETVMDLSRLKSCSDVPWEFHRWTQLMLEDPLNLHSLKVKESVIGDSQSMGAPNEGHGSHWLSYKKET